MILFVLNIVKFQLIVIRKLFKRGRDPACLHCRSAEFMVGYFFLLLKDYCSFSN